MNIFFMTVRNLMFIIAGAFLWQDKWFLNVLFITLGSFIDVRFDKYKQSISDDER